ncbi:DUF4838 domain-containing protein [Hwangdonia lutea]|uniref:DUF4838 domain-containing protein n=1 Tax=Hwangdonia lutea TaxID=3075823 RepID=A0AA97EKA0_9FLAO|nr:DUF4838 domain-containing protein [Hwangdonia sp. SCSIO 19198]WOD42667.1 DUF4838 domain-containing protein [Hwangdonia sp. SCSIO 19198]
MFKSFCSYALKTFNGLLIVFLMYSCEDKTITLVHDGASDYDIVFLGEATQSAYQSAEILQNYIQKISDVKLDIVDESSQNANKHKIYVGNVADEKLSKHQIQIKTNQDNIFIFGGSDEAIRNAVYEFLELYLDCKWYAPNVEDVPKQSTINLNKNLNYAYTPKITTRTVHSRLFYENERFAAQHKVTTKAFPYYVPSARVHTFNKFVPEEEFYKSNPEYFALRGNKRLPTQLCLTNATVLEMVKDSVRSLFKQYPEASVISVSGNDNTQFCECGKCKTIDEEEGSHAGTMIRFVNEIAKSFPEKTISTLAYQYTRKPCKTKPLKNVLITLCSIECDRSAPITEKCTDFADDLKGWSKLTDNIRIWDYTTQFTNFLAPFPNFKTLQPNIQFFRDHNTKWVFEQHSNNPSELFELRSYLMAKLIWNPDASVDDLITEFTNGYYHEAGVFVKSYVDLIHKELKNYPDYFLFLYGDPSQAFNAFLSPNLLKQYVALFDEAESAVANKPDILKRVKVARLSIDYAVLEACRKGISVDFTITQNTKNLVENFMSVCNEANITLMNEMGYTVTDYGNAYLKSIEVALQPNMASGKKVTLLTQPKKYANEDPQALTDGALGGSNFYSNWLGFEGNHLEAIIDLDEKKEVKSISTAFLQVTNHIVFFPKKVTYYGSVDGKNYTKLGVVLNEFPLNKKSKINDIQYFNLSINPSQWRYIKIKAESLKQAPYWHHGAGLPSWIFADEVIIN